MTRLFEPAALCTVCLARSTDADHQVAALALVMRTLLDKTGIKRHKKLTDAELVHDPSRYFTIPRREATALLQALGKLARPAVTEQPF